VLHVSTNVLLHLGAVVENLVQNDARTKRIEPSSSASQGITVSSVAPRVDSMPASPARASGADPRADST
jgi:hypothetical protein